MGAATGLNILWSFPVDDPVAKINLLAQRTLTTAYFRYDNEILSIQTAHVSQRSIMWGNERRRNSYDYVLSENIRPAGISVRIPMTFIAIVSAYIYLVFIEKDEKKDFNIPPLNAKISYHDIAGSKHQASYDLKFNLALVRSEKNSSVEFFAVAEAE